MQNLLYSVLSVVRRFFNHGLHGLGAASLSNCIYPPLYSVYSVLSVVRRFFNHGLHGLGAASLSNCIHPPLYSVYSVLSVVRRFFNHGLHGMHGVGGDGVLMVGQDGLGKMHQLFGEQMDSVIGELDGGLVA